ncbi:MAG: D-tyrosyl-tRNA(Tyr) deacylase [Clostridia bacterium]|nr:D-tyrosyl-tRNA(Tyr) deacylase [Clostridia bacterium]
MRLVYQRVSAASVTVDGEVVGQIGEGAVLLLGVRDGDTTAEADLLARKAAELRVFSDENGKFAYSMLDIGGDALVVSNFTLYGNCRHGRRPEFISAARPEVAEPLYEYYVQKLRDAGVKQVATGVFGAHMDLDIHGNGPVTILMDTDEMKKKG